MTAGTQKLSLWFADDADLSAVDPLAVLRSMVPPADDEHRLVVTLATVGTDGCPNARSVLLSDVDEVGLTFHTDVRSRKVAELMADERACIVGLWPERARQVVAQGQVGRLGAADAARAYRYRSRHLQLLAWLNDPEMAAQPLAARRRCWADFAARRPDALDPPPTWIGFRLVPHRVVFWQGDDMLGPSNRVEFCRSGAGWSTRRLPG